MSQRRILVIKLGALGDFIQALGPMRAIRDYHKQDHITLMTTKPYAQLGRDSGYFDDVIIDARPKWYQLKKWLSLKAVLNNLNIQRVYDLQNNDRTGCYFTLFNAAPEWVGIAKGASHRNTSPVRTQGKAFNGHKQTLALAGIEDVTIDSLSWMIPASDVYPITKPYALIVPGGSAKHPEKRWPAQAYGELCAALLSAGITPVILGTDEDRADASLVLAKAPKAISLISKTALGDIPALARDAVFAIGNDTGPMHLIAPTGCPCVVLFGGKTNPEKHGPLGTHVSTIQEHVIADIDVSRVLDTLEKIRR